MGISGRACAALIAAVGVWSASPAAAVVLRAEFTGVVSSGADADGLFGAPSGDLTGAAFRAVYLFDPDMGTFHNTGGRDELYGGAPFWSGVGPIVSAQLSIDGGAFRSFSTAGSTYAIHAPDACSPNCTYMNLQSYFVSQPDPNTYHYQYLANFGFAEIVSDNLHNRFSAVVTGGDGLAEFSEIAGGAARVAQLRLETRFVSVTGVPEPTTWALLILGLGFAGRALRQQRRSVVA